MVHNTAAQNISDAQIRTQIAFLNQAFNSNSTRNVPQAFGMVAASPNFRFELACRDPQGNLTTGIRRVETNTTSFSPNQANTPNQDPIKLSNSGGTDPWNTAEYLNIWVCNIAGGVIGYANFPNDPSPERHGVVMDFRFFGNGSGNITRNTVLVHEVGHYFNLIHIWGDDQNLPDMCSRTDFCGDTPNQAGSTAIPASGVIPFPQTDICSPTAPGVMFMNYMDYSGDEMAMFTSDQRWRMRSSIESFPTARRGFDNNMYVTFNANNCTYTASLTTYFNNPEILCKVVNAANPSIVYYSHGNTTFTIDWQNSWYANDIGNNAVKIIYEVTQRALCRTLTIESYPFSRSDFTGCGTTPSTCANTGSISYDRWNNIGGGSTIQDLRNNTNNLQNAPTVSQNLSVFQAPSNICDYCGTRIRGYVCPPTSGNYTFWVEGDDNTELWLSTTDQPANVQRIAYHNDWTGSLEWSKYGTQQSAPINLQAGQRYYIEALVK